MIKRLITAVCFMGVLSTGVAGAPQKSGASLFAGHFGYILEYPTDYKVVPKFGKNEDGTSEEVVTFIPPDCAKNPKNISWHQCGNLGLLRLYVSPQPQAARQMGTADLRKQVNIMVQRAKNAGEQPAAPAPIKAGNLRGLTFVKGQPTPQSLDTTTVIHGTKVVYVFEFQRSSKKSLRVVQSLMEVQP